ncbi:MAG TPA: extracellular solute-binding protein [Roseiflexaceae bacterium]|nr:extracellular solute-binding protein [Roseiflexaceae bacterium]
MGCGPSSTTVTPSPAAQNALAEPATLLLWHGWSGAERQVLSVLADRFNRKRTSGRILLQSVPLASFTAEFRSAVGAGSGPHLVLVPNTWLGLLASDNGLMQFAEAELAAQQKALLPAALAGAMITDRAGKRVLAGLPVRFDTMALFYNSANVLTPPADTVSLLESARGLGEPSADPPLWGLALNLSLDNTIGYLYAFEGRVFDDAGRLVLGDAGRVGAERWLAWLQSLNADTRIFAHTGSSISVDQTIKSGHALMTFDWSYQLAIYRSLWGESLGIAPLPRLAETGKAPQSYVRSDVIAINSRVNTAERQAALEFARYLAGEEAQAELLRADIQPARLLALEGDGSTLTAARALRAQAEFGAAMPNSVERLVVDQELRVMLQQVLMGLATPSDAVTDADRRLRERLVNAVPTTTP